jgi:hypothetical protein
MESRRQTLGDPPRAAALQGILEAERDAEDGLPPATAGGQDLEPGRRVGDLLLAGMEKPGACRSECDSECMSFVSDRIVPSWATMPGQARTPTTFAVRGRVPPPPRADPRTPLPAPPPTRYRSAGPAEGQAGVTGPRGRGSRSAATMAHPQWAPGSSRGSPPLPRSRGRGRVPPGSPTRYPGGTP